MRWQIPRLARIESLKDQETISLSRMLAEQARAIPEQPFLVWEGRAFSYAQANERVNLALTALHRLGVRPGGHVGVLMGNHPDVLTVVTALNRMGAVAVMLHTEARGATLEHALGVAPVTHLVVDPERAQAALEGRQVPVLCLGAAVAPEGCQALDPLMERDPELLEELALDQGRGEDLALLMFTSGTTGLPRAARLSNLRWVTAALGAAACCQLTPRDTVYCCLPLHHATGLLLAVSGALAGGARLTSGQNRATEKEGASARRAPGPRWSSTWGSCAATCSRRRPRRTTRATRCASWWATACAPRSGKRCWSGLGRCACWSSMAPPRATWLWSTSPATRWGRWGGP
jgi:putative long chain acyl-CoA synthase